MPFPSEPGGARRPPLTHIPIFFSPKMQANVAILSPSAHKPMEAIASWVELGIGLRVIMPTPAKRDDLVRAHDPGFVDSVLQCRTMNGFGTLASDVATSLPYTNGAMLSAAREALCNGSVAVAPASGFHHAGYATVGGFCTFNALMVTAFALKAEGRAERVGILDFDQHYGDGTDDIIRTLGVNFVKHFSSGAEYFRKSQANEFLQRIPQLVASMRDCDVILYQAGADPHVDDPLGGWLTNEQLAKRDYLVFAAASQLSIPIAWNLGGGYQSPLRKVLDIHDQTMLAAAFVYSLSSVGHAKH
jgi:acetoin utilization deacetylase AcuC-like enzyme